VAILLLAGISAAVLVPCATRRLSSMKPRPKRIQASAFSASTVPPELAEFDRPVAAPSFQVDLGVPGAEGIADVAHAAARELARYFAAAEEALDAAAVAVGIALGAMAPSSESISSSNLA
jgi:hypothetical protein